MMPNKRPRDRQLQPRELDEGVCIGFGSAGRDTVENFIQDSW